MRRRAVSCSSRLRCLAVVVALVLGVLIVEAGPASAAPTPAAKSFVECTDLGNGIYISAGGALLHVSSWSAYGYDGTANGVAEPKHSTATITTSSSCKAHTPKTPSNGTFVQAVVANSKAANGWSWSGSVYEIVGGSPITVHSWANVGKSARPTVVPVSAAVLSSLSSPGACPSTVAGCLYSRPSANTPFAGYSTSAKKATTFYKVDSVGHPVPQKSATSGEPVVDQTSIDACQRMTCNPDGNIVNAVSTGYGVLHVDGWAEDYPSPAAVSVQLSIGTSTFVLPADQPTSYVLASTAGDHGFSADLQVAAGSYALCGTVLGRAPGATTLALGCSNVSIPGAAPAKVHRPKTKAKGHHRLQIKWKQPDTHGSPISAYIVKTSTGKKKQVSGSRHKLVLKHLPGGRRVTVKVRAINAFGLGSYGKASKSVRVR